MAITGIKPVIRIRTASEDGVGQSLSQLIGGTRGLSEREEGRASCRSSDERRRLGVIAKSDIRVPTRPANGTEGWSEL